MKLYLIAFICGTAALFAEAPKFDPSSLSPIEYLSYSTVRIVSDLPNNGTSIGTGFFYSFHSANANDFIPVIVTNKHVVKNALKGTFVLTLMKNDGSPDVGNVYRFTISDFEKCWIPHPDPNVDLCIMPIVPLLNVAEQTGKHFFYRCLDTSLLPSADDIEGFMGMEQIAMVGYPIGLWDGKNNFPIFRRGILASNYKYDWNGKPEFLIDAACFPGSSGSPILICDLMGYATKKSRDFNDARFKLMGILWGMQEFTATGEIATITVPTALKPISVTQIPINLGMAIKATELKAFEPIMLKMVAQQKAAANSHP